VRLMPCRISVLSAAARRSRISRVVMGAPFGWSE
jgi:hypothetical protein